MSIVHFKEDVAYPSEPAAELATKLTSATVTPVYDIRGSHLGNVTNPKEYDMLFGPLFITLTNHSIESMLF